MSERSLRLPATRKLREWIAAEVEFLAWRTGLEAARRAWEAAAAAAKNGAPNALLMGLALDLALSWHVKRAEDIRAADREFIVRAAMPRGAGGYA